MHLSAGILIGMNLTNLLFLIVFCLPILFHDPPVLPKQSGLDSGRMTLITKTIHYLAAEKNSNLRYVSSSLRIPGGLVGIQPAVGALVQEGDTGG